jgi:hypothetical protein
MKRTKQAFDTWCERRTENQTPVSVTTEEERMFSTGNKNLVVYFERKNKEQKDKNVHKRVNGSGTQRLTAGVARACFL